MLNWSFSHHHSTWICHHTRTWQKLKIKYHFLHPEPILQPMECTYGIVVHVIWIGQIFVVVSIVASPSNGHLIQGFRDQNNLRNTCRDKKNVVYEYHLACKLPSTWAFPPTFFLTWQQLRDSIFYESEVCFLPFESQGTVFFLLKSWSEVCFLLLNRKGRA